MNERYTFERDDDGHWYMIPIHKCRLFSHLLSESSENAYADFNNEFDQHRIDSPTNYSFENPR